MLTDRTITHNHCNLVHEIKVETEWIDNSVTLLELQTILDLSAEFKDEHFIIELQESHCFVCIKYHKISNTEKLAFATFSYFLYP